MRIPRWRLALTAGAVLVLAVAGVGLVSGAPARPSADPTAAEDLARARFAWPHLGKNVVHGVVTFDRGDQGLVTLQLDHGTIDAVSAASLTVAEKGGAKVTVALDEKTRVRRHGQKASVADLKTADEVFVLSRVPDGGGTPIAKVVFVPFRLAD